jgi:hypothetical protein
MRARHSSQAPTPHATFSDAIRSACGRIDHEMVGAAFKWGHLARFIVGWSSIWPKRDDSAIS